MREPEAKSLIRADNRELSGDLNKSKKLFHRTFGSISRGIKGHLGGAMGMIGAGGAALGIATVGKEVVDFEDSLNRIEIQAGMTAGQTDVMRQSMVALSSATGISRGEIVGTATSLINLTGDIEFTQKALEVLAKANLATGASMDDLSGLAFSLQKSFELTDPEQLEKGLSAIITAGKKGAIPLGEMSLILQQLSASFSDLGGTGVEGASDLAAALQVLRPAFGTASEAGTGLQSMMTALKKKSVALGKEGIQVFAKDAETGGKKFRGLRAILDDLANSDLVNNPDLLVKILGRVEAEKTIKAWTLGRGEFEKLSKAARESNAVQEDSDKRRESSAWKMKKAVNDAKEAIASTFTPDRIKSFAQAMGGIADVIAFIVDHAIEFAVIWGGIKIAGLANSMAAMAASTSTMATGAGVASASMSKMSMVAPAIGAAIAGWGIGTALDGWLGLSDKISDMANDSKGYGGSRGIRDRSDELLANEGAKAWGFDTMSNEDQVRKSKFLISDAKKAGIMSADGSSVNRKEAFLASHNVSRNGVDSTAAESQGYKDDKTQAVIDSLAVAAKVLEEAAKKNAQGVSVSVSVDEGGIMRVFESIRRDVRRGTQ